MFDSVKSDQIVIIGKGLTFKTKFTKREHIEKAIGKINIGQKGWNYEGLKKKFDESMKIVVPVECVLVFKPSGDYRGTSKDVAKEFKKMIK